MLELIILTVALIVGSVSSTMTILYTSGRIYMSHRVYVGFTFVTFLGLLAAGNMFSAVTKIILNS